MKQNRVVCKPGPALLFFTFRFEYLISGPKSYRDFRETGPWPLRNYVKIHFEFAYFSFFLTHLELKQ